MPKSMKLIIEGNQLSILFYSILFIFPSTLLQLLLFSSLLGISTKKEKQKKKRKRKRKESATMGEQSPQAVQIKPTLVPPSASFRLRSKSLNSVRLRRVFDLFDKNGDEYITVDEMADALARLGLITDPSELALTISGFIRPGAIGLDFNDFQVLHQTLGDALFGTDPINPSENNSEEADMREAFNVFDEDGDGFISAKELKTVLEKLGLAEGESMDRVQIMICSVDQNHDGRVDFGEFKTMMKSIDVESS